MRPPPDPDDTVEIRPPTPPRRRRGGPAAVIAIVVVTVAGAGGFAAWQLRPPAAPSEPAAGAALALSRPKSLAAPQPVAPQQAAPDIAIRAADEATILAHEAAALTVFRFAANPAVLVLDFPTLGQQARMLNRAAVFVEKAGLPHDRVLDDAALDAAIRGGGDEPETFYYGHDYRTADLRRFFATAERDHVALTPEELWLRDLMTQQGWMDGPKPAGTQLVSMQSGARAAEADRSGGAAMPGAIISVPRTTADGGVDARMRAVILHHELSHGEYFTSPAYAEFSGHFWTDTLSAQDRALFRAMLGRDHYDTGIEDLMVNETQAYLMHTRDDRFFSAATLGMPQSRLDFLRAAFLVNMPRGWLRDCTPGPDAAAALRGPRRRRSPGARARPLRARGRPRRADARARERV